MITTTTTHSQVPKCLVSSCGLHYAVGQPSRYSGCERQRGTAQTT